MKIALCNEVIADRDFAAQCELAAELGYDGLEVAPYTLDEQPHLLSAQCRGELRRSAQDAGIEITGLHWLLVTPEGLSINTPDASVRARTIDVIERLIGLCADLGGTVLVHGSPAQRSVAEDDDPDQARHRAVETFRAAGRAAAAAGVSYCVEPLAPRETNFINTVAEAAALVDEIAQAALKTMVDTSAAGLSETTPVDELLAQWLPSGKIIHVQLNDRNRRGPGQGSDRFAPILSVLKKQRYDRVVAVEPFVYRPDGATSAARAIGYLRGILEALA